MPDQPVSAMPASLYRYILSRTFRRQVVLAVLTVILAGLSFVPLELQRRALDDAVANSDVELLFWLAVAYLAAILASAAIKFMVKLGRDYVSAGMQRTLRDDTFRNIYTEDCPPKTCVGPDGAVDSGAVVSIMSSEVEKLGAFAGNAISGPLLQVGTLIAVLGYMFIVEPLIAGVAIALYLPQFVIVPLAQARMNRLAAEKAQVTRDLGDFLVDSDPDSLAQPEPPGRFGNLADDIHRLRRKFVRTKHIMKTINNVLIALGPFGVVAYGGYLVIQGEVKVGVIVAFISGLERVGDPIRELISTYRSIADARMRYGILLDSFVTQEPADAAPV